MATRSFSKSKLLACRQCPKRLWLEVHQRDSKEDSEAAEARYQVGYQVGEIARRLYDPGGAGVLVDVEQEGFDGAFARSLELLETSQPIFEAGFSAAGALAFADVLLPVEKCGSRTWRMIEVKSSTSVKDYHHDDIAVQAFVAKKAGVPLESVALAHIDSSWVYPGDGNYGGLLVEEDLTETTIGREAEVEGWIAAAAEVAAQPGEPEITTGRHCFSPFECGFLGYCQSQEPKADFPIGWLPRLQSRAVKTLIEEEGLLDMRELSDDLLSAQQQRVKAHTLADTIHFDAERAATALSPHDLPAYFMDFETIQFAVPIWKGTRPYQQIPFQFSVHRLDRERGLQHIPFLDLSGEDPNRGFAQALIDACGREGPIFVYNADFEKGRVKDLAERFPDLAPALLAINERVVDLLPIAREHYYHPSQQGSWSLKAVLPAVVPELSYGALEGIQDGGMAMDAFLEALHPETSAARQDQIRAQLDAYCAQDTYALVRIWQVFAGRNDLRL